MTPATCGPTSPESYETPKPRTAFSRTSADTFRLGSPTSLPTLPPSGSMRSGAVSPRPRSVRRTDGSGYSCWPIGPNYPTPDAGVRSGYNQGGAKREGPKRPTLEELGKNWKTPHGMGGKDHTGKLGSGGEFAKQATSWSTPHANCTTGAGSQGREGGDNLQTQAGRASGPPAPETPTDGRESSPIDPTSRPHYQTPRSGRRGPPGQSDRHDGQPKGMRLNPRFVEWLMGFPQDWSLPCATAPLGSARLETLLYLRRLNLLSANSGGA